ncbi:glutamine synthetase 2 cytoplasmic-like [Zophobas morio]|uniref:glutamine synthetase 2 cytoplasmic-like n=1 Tax=Zophobas morio TaxID=2755281 RepID=UPI003083DDD8
MKFLNRNIQIVCKLLSRSIHLEWSPNWKISKKVWDRFSNLPIANCKVQATYIWIDGTGENLRAKNRILDFTPNSYKECPNWDFDGSTTFLADDPKHSDIILCPIALYNDPFQRGTNKLVLCETYTSDGKPTKSNSRHCCMTFLNQVCDKEPRFGFKQTCMFMDADKRPFGWPKQLGYPCPTESHCYSVGADKALGRELIECVCRCCLYSGLELGASHPAVVPSQWQVGLEPTAGIRAADELWILRYFLQRIGEIFGVVVSFEPKLYPSWKGSGCHTKFSTKEMRNEGGYKFMEEAMKKLATEHEKHMDVYDIRGCHNKQLDGDHSTFRWGVADRTGCVRIPKKVEMDKKGYFEDMRVPANADPYKVVSIFVRTLCLE